MSLFLSVETSVKYLFPLLSLMYPSSLSIIKYKGFSIDFCIAKVFNSNIPNVINNDLYDVLSLLIQFGLKFLILKISLKKSNMYDF